MRLVYNNGADIIEIVTRDSTGRCLDKVRANVNDEEEVARITQFVLNKMGVDLKVIKSENKNTDWLKADEEFKW